MCVKKFLLCCAAMLSLVVVAGCGSKAGFCEFEGLVTWNGEPVPGVSIDFTPVGKDMRGSTGVTDGDGKFKTVCTATRAGLQGGENDAVFSFDGQENIWYGGDFKGSPALAKEVAKYSKTHGPIRIEVNGANKDYRFELPLAE